jgi:hypothetical protein
VRARPHLTLFPLLQLREAEKATAARSHLPAAIPSAPFLSDGRRGVGEGGGPGNHRAGVYRVGRSLPRSRFGREGVPLRHAFPGVVGEVEASMTLGNNFSRLLLRPDGILL